MSSNRVLSTIADESEIAQSVSRVTIHTESDSGTDTTPTTRRKRRRHRQNKPEADGSMEVDAKKEPHTERSNNGPMDWETVDSDLDSDNSYGYIDADDEQSDFPDYAIPRSSRPDASQPQRRLYTRHGIGLPIQRKIERFLYSAQKELTLNQVYNSYAIERYIRRKKVMLIKRGRGVLILRKME
uniref:22K n=1 Tax=Panagrellus redivivus TaxID=6233 RepID=A0A7E4VWA7_PANRE